MISSLVDGYMLEAAPLPEQAAARQCELLHDAADDLSVPASSDARQVPRPRLVARHEGCVLRCDHELVQVAVAAPRGGEAEELAIRRVDDNPLSVCEAMHDLALPPGQHRLPVEESDLEIGRGLADNRPEPDKLAGVVEDHRTALARTRGRGDEQEPGRRAVSGLQHRHRRRLQIGTRDELLQVPARRCFGGLDAGRRSATRVRRERGRPLRQESHGV